MLAESFSVEIQARGDLRLTPAAVPALDAGTALEDFQDDVDGHPRPRGSGWDLGAGEFDPGTPKVPPRTPADL